MYRARASGALNFLERSNVPQRDAGAVYDRRVTYPMAGSNALSPMGGFLVGINIKRAERPVFIDVLAEIVGFEPTVRYNRTPDFECDEQTTNFR
jgi:hypothetical protein